jgi:hypothetical protein
MDDIVVLVPSHWKFRKAVRVVNQTLNRLQLEKHPEKTFIGKIERGFEFLGYHFRPGRLTVAQKTVERFVERAIQLYEQEPGETCASSQLGTYVQRWGRWARAGVPKGAVCGIPPSGAFPGCLTLWWIDSPSPTLFPPLLSSAGPYPVISCANRLPARFLPLFVLPCMAIRGTRRVWRLHIA